MPQTFLGQPPYDQTEAREFVLGRVEAPDDQVRQVLGAQAKYQVLLGLAPTSVLPDDERVGLEGELDAHRDLLPNRVPGIPGACVWHLETEYILRTTRCPLLVVTESLEQEMAYQVSIGIRTPEELAEYRRFVAWVLLHNRAAVSASWTEPPTYHS